MFLVNKLEDSHKNLKTKWNELKKHLEGEWD